VFFDKSRVSYAGIKNKCFVGVTGKLFTYGKWGCMARAPTPTGPHQMPPKQCLAPAEIAVRDDPPRKQV
jgi:hypothetical protein